MDLRPYQPADRDACLAVFDSNTPTFLGSNERRDFEEFLNGPNCPYFVMDLEGAIAGCGGYRVGEEPELARLVWGMVHRDWQRKGLGRFLLLFRVREITKAGGVRLVRLDAPPRLTPFFEHQGFKMTRAATGGSGDGLDRVEMTMKLAVCP